MFRIRLFLLSFFLVAPVFSADPNVRELLVRYKTRPTSVRTLAAPSKGDFSKKMHPAKMAAFQAARSKLERTAVVAMPSGAELKVELAKWRARSDVEFVEPNWPMHISVASGDLEYPNQWALHNTGQAGGHDSYDPATGTAGSDVDAEGAWDITTGSDTVVVAVIDAGMQITHPDLVNNIDLTHAYDFADNDGNPNDDCSNANPLFDAGGHGTHVTGIVGAEGDNGIGVTGINWHVSIMPLKVAKTADCEILTDDVVDAINYAVANGARIINMSLGGPADLGGTLEAAIDAADMSDVLVVAAAGNEGTEDFSSSYPAAFSTSYNNVISVGATDRTDHFASFSNRGNWVSLSAPGVGIRSTYPSNSYAYLSGTSMASPLVAGAAALLLADNPALTPVQIRDRFMATAENIDALNPSYVGKMGSGRLNVANALFSIDSVSPSTAPNTGSFDVTLAGFNFSSGMTAKLTRGAQTIFGTGLGFGSVTTATVAFDLSGQVGGRWDVMLVKVNGSSATLSEGFGILSQTFNVLSLTPTQSTTTTIQTVRGTTHTVVWPAGVFSQTISLDVGGDPTLAGVTSIDPYVATGVGIELNALPSSLSVATPFTLTLEYELTDLFDPNNESALTIARYDEDHARWKPLASTVDTAARTVTASVDHLSTFAILQATASANLSRALAYPNPFRAEAGHNRIVFDFLTAGAEVRIFDVSGSLVRELHDDNNDGQIIWNDVRNDSGDNVASGIYFYLITDPQGRKEKGRIGVIR